MSVEKLLDQVRQELLADGETSLDFLRRVYRSPRQPMSLRMRAATEALPHEHPRMTAVSVGYYDGNSFAQRLDRAIDASNRAKVIEGYAIRCG